MRKCKLCESDNVIEIYHDEIRNGGLEKYTSCKVPIYQCKDCNVIFHEPVFDVESYYESQEYRQSLEGTSEEEDFYRLHDKDSMDKFLYTGTTRFRNKIVADIGCGCGAFLDYIKGVAKSIVAIEPSETYRDIMDKKGFSTYAYAADAHSEWKEKIDVITSFDVIEHVESPIDFLTDIYNLLNAGGQAVIGTPTDAPVMRALLGEIYEKKILFSTQHLWIFSHKNLEMIAKKAGFKKIEIKYFQRYGLDNFLGWIREKQPNSEIHEKFITETLDSVWKSQLVEHNLADYIVLYVEK